MEVKEKKKYLNQAYTIERHIETLIAENEKIKRLWAKCQKCTVSYENDGTKSGTHNNSTENNIINYIDAVEEYRQLINGEIDKLIEAKKKIKQLIENVTNENAREILYKRFVACLDFNTIQNQMHYSKSRMYELFDIGLSEIKLD